MHFSRRTLLPGAGRSLVNAKRHLELQEEGGMARRPGRADARRRGGADGEGWRTTVMKGGCQIQDGRVHEGS